MFITNYYVKLKITNGFDINIIGFLSHISRNRETALISPKARITLKNI